MNTAHVAASDEGSFSARLIELKKVAVENPLASNDPFAALVRAAGSRASDAIESSDGTIEVASFDFGGGGASIPITISLPEAAKDAAPGFVERLAETLIDVHSSISGSRPWD